MKIGDKTFNPGEMNVRITLLRRENVTGPGGHRRPNYVPVKTVWAKWVNAHGTEAWVASGQQVISPATVTIRYLAMDETWAVQKGGEVFEVVSMDNIREKNELLELNVKKVIGA